MRTVSRWSHVSQVGYGVLFLLASIVLRPRRFLGVEPERRLGGRRDLGLFLFRLLGFAVSALLTFCHRNPPLNEARGCDPGVTPDGRAFRFCKQPLEVGENVRTQAARRCCGGSTRGLMTVWRFDPAAGKTQS